jgi:molybdopterin synthase catalytic subunit
MNRVRITLEPFAPSLELSALGVETNNIGALASFTGYCRGETSGARVKALELEHYPGFSERVITENAARIATSCRAPFWRVVHRVGCIGPGEAIVLVAAASAHRAEAFLAVEHIMDFLKTDAPFWKREHLCNGAARWVEPSAMDHARRARAQ